MLRFTLNSRGFTLIELMMTIAVAATLLAIGVPVLMDVTENSKLNAAARNSSASSRARGSKPFRTIVR